MNLNQNYNDFNGGSEINNLQENTNLNTVSFNQSSNVSNVELLQDSNSSAKKENNKQISKGGRILMLGTLISSIVIILSLFVDNKLISSWKIAAIVNNDTQASELFKTVSDSISVVNWAIVLSITILSIVFLIKDKKKHSNTNLYSWYIVAGILNIFESAVGLALIIYSIVALVFAIRNRKNNKLNNLSVKSDNTIIIISLIVMILIVYAIINF